MPPDHQQLSDLQLAVMRALWDRGEATVLDHLKQALVFNLERCGAHGLPCGLDADWNDCLRLGYKGESTFVTFQVRHGLLAYADICSRLGRDDEAQWALEQCAQLDECIKASTWDGQWFIRAYREDGSIIGTHADSEGSIFLNPQSWAVISGAATDEQALTAMESVHERLATPFGVMVCTPPFRATDYHVVRAVLINEGQKENGGIFSHPQGWAVMAETMLGHGARALRYYRAYMPAAYNERAEIRQIEPYVHCQSTHSTFSRRYGASRIPWLSGTAAWSYVAGTQYILGVRPEYDGLCVDPCVPEDWKEFTVVRRFRGRRCTITVRNPDGVEKGVAELTVNGEKIEGTIVPAAKLTDETEIVAVMG